MMKTGQKFNMSLEALKLSDLAKEQLPMWYHLGTGQQQQQPIHLAPFRGPSAS